MRARSLNTPGLIGGGDGDGAPVARPAELELAVALGEDRVVLADPGARARPEARAALADDDRPRFHVLPAEQLDPEALRVRVTAVAGGAKTFFVRHLSRPSWLPACEPGPSWRPASLPPRPSVARPSWRCCRSPSYGRI